MKASQLKLLLARLLPQSYVDPQDAATWYYNLDHLMRHVNADGRVKVFYSTPLRYVEAKRKESQVKWPLKAPRHQVGGDPWPKVLDVLRLLRSSKLLTI